MARPRILIIDDDPNLRKTLADILMLKGYEPLTAEDGEKGLDLLREQKIKMVLLDLGLPDIPGLEVLARIKSDSPRTGVIVLTGQATIDSAVAATNQGAFSYLVKPYKIVELIGQIQRASEKQRADEEIARHQIELERMNAELKTLREISEAINQTLDMDELVKEILQVLVRTKIFPFEVHAAIYLMDDDKMRLASFVNLPATALNPCQEIFRGQCLCGETLSSGEVVILDAGEIGASALCHSETEAYGRIIVPLKAVKTITGLLSLYIEPGTEVSEELRQLLASLGSQIGMALNNARRYEQTKSTSLHDALTGLANRRFLDIQLEKSFEAAKRYQGKLSVVMLDIDHFKRYNDRHGHQGGDRLLAKLAEVLVQQLRTADFVFRYGGEEFLCMLPETNLSMACLVAERLRRAVEAETDVTISLGVAAFTDHLPNQETLVEKADAALYQAKEKGRNRVERSEVTEDLG